MPVKRAWYKPWRKHAATSLQRLEGLTLDSIFGDFAIASNPSLQTIEALDSLKYIGGHLVILENPVLENLVGLDSLDFASGNVEILYNQGLQNLNGCYFHE